MSRSKGAMSFLCCGGLDNLDFHPVTHTQLTVSPVEKLFRSRRNTGYGEGRTELVAVVPFREKVDSRCYGSELVAAGRADFLAIQIYFKGNHTRTVAERPPSPVEASRPKHNRTRSQRRVQRDWH